MASTLRWVALSRIARQARATAGPGTPSLSSRLSALPRLIRSVLRGEYQGMPRTRLVGAALALAYVLSPIDLVPEAVLPLVGLADDAVVIAWLAAALNQETASFLNWEANRRVTVPSHLV